MGNGERLFEAQQHVYNRGLVSEARRRVDDLLAQGGAEVPEGFVAVECLRQGDVRLEEKPGLAS